MKILDKSYKLNKLSTPCSNIHCKKVDCPNYNKEIKSRSFGFPSCMYNPVYTARKEKELDAKNN